MILTFSKEQFVQQIIDRKKIHTIREDKSNRWKEGMKIHFWKGNPRNVNNNPYPFAEGTVTYVQKISIRHRSSGYVNIWVNDVELDGAAREELAINDGFEGLKSFLIWFNKDFTGKLIHWEIEKVLI